jgi:hypothetical protein
MANITTCPECGSLYEAGSEEQANEPGRLCRRCWAALAPVAQYVTIDVYRDELEDAHAAGVPHPSANCPRCNP